MFVQFSTVTRAILNGTGRKYLDAPDLRGKIFVTAGLGGMSGAQPKAAVICGAVGICAEVSREAAEKRHRQGWVVDITDDLDECLQLAQSAAQDGRGTSIAYVGNVVDVWERLAELSDPSSSNESVSFVPHLGSDQTSCHIPFSGGYYPVGYSYEESKVMMAEDPQGFKDAVQESLRRQVTAINTLVSRGMRFWDYGNSFLLEASRAGADILKEGTDSESAGEPVFRYPSYVQDIMGDIFSLGFGPFRWVCTSASPEDLALTDQIALGVLNEIRDQLAEKAEQDSAADVPGYASRAVPQLDDNILWITEADDHKLVVGSQARILYANAEARSKIAAAFNEAIADGRLSRYESRCLVYRSRIVVLLALVTFDFVVWCTSPVMLSRDHHDVSGTDAPWRETSNIEDGSKFCADMAVHNVIGDASRGATSVSASH